MGSLRLRLPAAEEVGILVVAEAGEGLRALARRRCTAVDLKVVVGWLGHLRSRGLPLSRRTRCRA